MRTSTYKYLESELFDYPYIAEHIKRVRDEVQNPWIEQDENIGGGRSNVVTSPIEKQVTRLVSDRRLMQLERIQYAIENVYRQCDDTERQMIELYYFKKPRLYTPDGIADKLHISRRQFFKIKKDIIGRLADELGIMH